MRLFTALKNWYRRRQLEREWQRIEDARMQHVVSECFRRGETVMFVVNDDGEMEERPTP